MTTPMTMKGGSAMKNQRHQVIWLLAAAGSRSCTTRPVNVPVWNSSPISRNVKNVISPTAAAPGLRGANPMASAIPRAIGTPRAIRVEPLVSPAVIRTPVRHRTTLWGMNRGGRRWSDSSTSRNMRPDRATATPTARSVKIMFQAGAAKPPRMSAGGHQAGQDEGERQEEHHDVVGQHVGDEQRHGRDDGRERDEPAALEPFRQGQDPSQPEEDDRREGAQRAQGREPLREPAEERAPRARGCRAPPADAGAAIRSVSCVRSAPSRAPSAGRALADRGEPAVQVPGRGGLEQVGLVGAEELLGVLDRARREREVRGRDDLAGRRHLLGRGAQPRRIRLADVRAGDGEEGRIDDEVRSLGVQQAGVLDELGQGVRRPRCGRRSRRSVSAVQRGRTATSATRRAAAGLRRPSAAVLSRWLSARRAPVSWFIAASRWLRDRSMLRAMPRSWSRSVSKRGRERRQTVRSVSATTVAVRGESVRSAISPKTSPGPSVVSRWSPPASRWRGRSRRRGPRRRRPAPPPGRA